MRLTLPDRIVAPQTPGSLPSWVEVHPGRIRRNLSSARAYLAPGNRFCAVLKADCYGHGMENVLPVLMQEGVDFIGITANAEARAARALGYSGRVLRLRAATRDEMAEAQQWGVEEQVGSLDAARALAALRSPGGGPTRVHLALNAGGMGREGLELFHDDGRGQCAAILSDGQLRIEGVMTHFPSNSAEHLAENRARFARDVGWVLARIGRPREDILVHAGSSLTLMARETDGYDMVRCGAVLYGIVGPREAFADTMALKARVSAIGAFPKGAPVGYDRVCRLTRDSRLANVTIGYANGYRRGFGNRATALIRGRKLPVLGKISMNSLVVDVTDLAEARVDDEVVLFGQQGGAEIVAGDVEPHADTILADLYVDWGQSNARLARPG